METKKCCRCKQELETSMFYRNKKRKDGLASDCIECHKDYLKKTYELSGLPPQRREALKVSGKGHRDRLKMEVMTHYGRGNSNCKCGFSDIRALTIDHIDGQGSKHLNDKGKKLNGTALHRWLKKQSFPEGFQVLCMCCQWIKRHENGEYN